MNCATHAETPAVGFCRNCGRAVCAECRRDWQGIPHCNTCFEDLVQPEEPVAASPGPAHSDYEEPSQEQAAREDSASAWSPPPRGAIPTAKSVPGTPLPALAAILGFIPGVGAVYNGQYAKGLVHALLWGGLLGAAIASDASNQSGSVAVFVILIIFMTLYMPIEAARTAQAIRRGETVEELPKVFGVNGGHVRSPIGGFFLIFLGIVFLLHSLGYWQLGQVVRFWPVILIALGIHLLYRRAKEQSDQAEPPTAATSGGAGLPSLRPEAPPSDAGENIAPLEDRGPASIGGEERAEPRASAG